MNKLTKIAFICLFIASCSDQNSDDKIKAVIEMGEVRTQMLPRIIVTAKVISSYPEIEPNIVLDFTDYLTPVSKRSLPTGVLSVTLVRQQPPQYYYNVLGTMYE